jgi:CDP-diacylglycerol--serine O-phosphatidyltransferase
MGLVLKMLKQAQRKKRYQKTLQVLPHLVTFGNAICGLLSIVSSLEGNITMAAITIFLAAAMDGLDGRLARALDSTSSLGTELDSLSDAISFCVAPAVLLYRWKLSEGWLGIGLLIGLVCAGLYRLARFNSNAGKQIAYFKGLPTPLSALFIASFVMHRTWLEQHNLTWLLQPSMLFLIITVLALLMVSSIPFYSCKTMSGWLLSMVLLASGGIIMTALVYDYPLMPLILSGYVVATLMNAGWAIAKHWQILKF